MRKVLAALLATYAFCVAGLCIWDGLKIPSPPRSNLRYEARGLRVNIVARDDVLDRAGIQRGDIIVATDGIPLRNSLDLPDRFHAIRPGSRITFTVERDGEVLELGTSTWPNLGPREAFEILLPLLIVFGLGVGVFAARPLQRGSFLFLLFCLSVVLNIAATATLPTGTGWALRVISFSYTILSLPSAALLLHLFTLFPAELPFQRRLRSLLPLAYGICFALGLHYYLPGWFPILRRMPFEAGLTRFLLLLFGFNVLACDTLIAVNLALIARRARQHRVQQQAKLLFAALLITLLARLVTQELPVWLGARPLLDVFSQTMVGLVFPIAIAISIVVQRLFDINILVRHGLVYSLASGVMAVVFIAVMGGLGWILRSSAPRTDAVALAVAAAVAAVAFHPLRIWSQHAVDRYIYRRRYDYRKEITAISTRLAGILDPEAAAAFLRSRIGSLLDPSWMLISSRRPTECAFVLLDTSPGTRPLLCAGEEAKRFESLLSSTALPFQPDPANYPLERVPELVVPATRGDAVLGALLLGARRSDVPYMGEDTDFLGTLGNLMATVFERGHLLEERSLGERLALVGSATSALIHELKNPLAAIKSTAAVLRRRLREDERGQELTHIVEDEADRLLETVIGILSYVRPSECRMEPVNLEDLLGQIARVVEVEFSSHDVEIRLECTLEKAVVIGDSERLRQLFLNLLLNAREASGSHGEIHVRLDPWMGSAGELRGVEVTLQDSGSGFAPDSISRVFEPFFTTKKLGTGLGLANVKRIVEEHSGEVLASNAAEGGALVTVRLPSAPRNPALEEDGDHAETRPNPDRR